METEGEHNQQAGEGAHYEQTDDRITEALRVFYGQTKNEWEYGDLVNHYENNTPEFLVIAEEATQRIKPQERALYTENIRILELLAKLYANAVEEHVMELISEEPYSNIPYKGPEVFAEFRKLKEILMSVIENPDSVYFLSMRARSILKSMEDESIYGEKIHYYGQPLPSDFFRMIAPDKVGFFTNNKLYIASATEEISEAVIKSRTLTLKTQLERDAALDKGEGYAWTKDTTEPLAIYSEIIVNASKTPTSEDFGVARVEGQDIEDFGHLKGEMEEDINEEFSCNLSDLSLREQFWFLQFTKQKESREADLIRKFTRRYSINGLRTFLALDQKPGLGDKIVEFGNRHNNVAGEVFAKFSEIVGAAEDAGPEVASNLLTRASNLLERFVKQEELDEKELLDELSKVEVSNEIFLATYKALPDSEKVSALESMKDATFEIRTADRLSADEIEAMREMYRRNYKDPKYAKLLPKLLEKFDETLKDKKARARFYIFRHKGVIRAFNRFTDVVTSEFPYEMHKYFGAFNVDKNFAGASIGETMMLASLDEEAETDKIEADTEATSAIAMNYIERGFIADRFYNFEGVESLHIWRNDNDYIKGKSAYSYPSKKLSRDEIIQASNIGSRKGATIVSGSKPETLELNKNLRDGQVLTRYFFDKDTNKYYAVFEALREEAPPEAYIF
ncbi:MAG TPA: hypothetical protein VI953_03640 [Candidatus Paceibacterota bacterium]